MKAINKFQLILILLLFVQFSALGGGGWPQKRGHGYLKLAQWWISSDQHFTNTGAIDPNVTSGILNTSLYAEIGLTDRFTITGYIPFFSRATINNIVSATTGEVTTPGDAINSFGDTDLGLTYGLTSGKFNTSVSIILGLPLGVDDGGEQNNLQTGDGEFNQQIRFDLGVGYSLGGNNAYASTYVGYNNRTNDFSDEFRFGIESGVNLFNNKLLALVRVFGVISMQNGVDNAFATGTSVFANNAEHISFTPELNYNIGDNWGVSVAVGGAFWGRLIFANPSYSVGVYSKF